MPVHGTWLQDIEALEQISQNEPTRQLFLRMAALQRTGRIGHFLDELRHDPDVDDDTKGTLSELAQDAALLLAVEDYCAKTDRLH